MYIKDLIKLTDGTLMNIPHINKKINNFRLDSRKIKKGDVFICINSGTNYIEDAINNGAICIISEKNIRLETKICIIKVDDIKDTLIKIGTYIRYKYKNIPLVAITGSVGKSSTKELVADILSTKYHVLKSEGNKNNYIGVVDTLFNINKKIDVIVLELGMNHMHEIEELSHMVKPDISIITGIGTSHIGNLGSKKNIFRAKMEIIEGMRGGYLIVPPNDYYLTKLKLDNVLKCYDINIKHVKIDNKLKFQLRYNNMEYNIKFNIPNKDYINNIILSFKLGTLFNIDEKDIVNKINNFKSLDKRMNIIKCSNYIIIDDSYNSSYESVKGAFNYIKKFSNKKLIIVGDIKELGSYSKKIHKKIDYLLKKIKNKEVLLVGDEVKIIDGIHFNSNEEINNYLMNKDLDNYIILIKGSRAMKLDEVKDYIIENL